MMQVLLNMYWFEYLSKWNMVIGIQYNKSNSDYLTGQQCIYNTSEKTIAQELYIVVNNSSWNKRPAIQ